MLSKHKMHLLIQWDILAGSIEAPNIPPGTRLEGTWALLPCVLAELAGRLLILRVTFSADISDECKCCNYQEHTSHGAWKQVRAASFVMRRTDPPAALYLRNPRK